MGDCAHRRLEDLVLQVRERRPLNSRLHMGHRLLNLRLFDNSSGGVLSCGLSGCGGGGGWLLDRGLDRGGRLNSENLDGSESGRRGSNFSHFCKRQGVEERTEEERSRMETAEVSADSWPEEGLIVARAWPERMKEGGRAARQERGRE